ncbi:MAG TPA: VOC family protein [Thermoplasmata archaeon]|nr:VOC family protein [Thermoplasmata archaeon]
MQRIIPFLWFDDQAEEAARFYTSIFRRSKIVSVTRQPGAKRGQKGAAMSVVFRIEGQAFMALNGGPGFPFTEAISFYVECRTQREVDELWRKLLRGGQPSRCGWLKDRFGVSWQIVPSILGEYLADTDPVKANRVFEAMLKMVKLDIEGLKRAYRGV